MAAKRRTANTLAVGARLPCPWNDFHAGYLRSAAMSGQGQAAFPEVVGKLGGRSLANAASSLAVQIGLWLKSPA